MPHVQAVIFDNKYFDDKQAEAWLRAHGFMVGMKDAKKRTTIYKQMDAKFFECLYIINAGEPVAAGSKRVEKGVKFVMGAACALKTNNIKK